RTTQHAEEINVTDALAEQFADRIVVRHRAFEIGFHRGFVDFDSSFDELLTIFFGTIFKVSRDIGDVPGSAELLAVPDTRLHLDQVDNTGELVLSANRQLQNDSLSTQTGSD